MEKYVNIGSHPLSNTKGARGSRKRAQDRKVRRPERAPRLF